MDTFPWERRGEIGVVRAFADNLVLSVRAPTRFFGLAPRDASYWPAVLYGFVFEVVVGLATFAYAKLFGEAELVSTLGPYYPQLEEMLPGGPAQLETFLRASSAVSLLATPFSYLLELHVIALVTWVGLRLAGGLRTSFGHIVRLLAYAGWVRVFGLLGVSGDVVLSLLGGLLSIGFASYIWVALVRASQGIDMKQAVIASLYGTLVGFLVGCVVVVPPTVLLVLWVASKLAAGL